MARGEPRHLTIHKTNRMPPRDQWDAFAQRCEASYQCSQGYIAPKRLTHKLRIFELFFGDHKIGQCAVGEPRIGKGRPRIFLDSIQLVSSECSWAAAMQAVLRTLGPGRYCYGSLLSPEAARDDDLQTIHGIKIINSEFYRVQAVDFSKWPDWDSYHRQISTNARRNATRAHKSDANMRIEETIGHLPSIRNLFRMLAMRRNVYRRKHVSLEFVGWSVQLLRRLVLLRRYITVWWVIFGGHYTSFAVGLQFGDRLYYTDGASLEDNGGSAWYLLIELLRKAKEAHPAGKFVMGFDPVVPWTDAAGWQNVLRQRQQCRVSASLTSVVVFDYNE
jgi:hypothetical protein